MAKLLSENDKRSLEAALTSAVQTVLSHGPENAVQALGLCLRDGPSAVTECTAGQFDAHKARGELARAIADGMHHAIRTQAESPLAFLAELLLSTSSTAAPLGGTLDMGEAAADEAEADDALRKRCTRFATVSQASGPCGARCTWTRGG